MNVIGITPLLAVPVDELRSGVWMRFEPREWEVFFDSLHASKSRFLSFVPLCTDTRPVPSGVNSGHTEGEIALERIAAMRDGIDLLMPRRQVFPGALEDRDDRFESRWFRRGETSPYSA